MLDEIEFRGVKDTNTRVLGLMRAISTASAATCRPTSSRSIETTGNAKVLEAKSMRVMMMQFNTTRAPFNDVHVRRALN